MGEQLRQGDPFPRYVVDTVDGGGLEIPRDLLGGFSVLIFYRGHW